MTKGAAPGSAKVWAKNRNAALKSTVPQLLLTNHTQPPIRGKAAEFPQSLTRDLKANATERQT